MGSVMSK